MKSWERALGILSDIEDIMNWNYDEKQWNHKLQVDQKRGNLINESLNQVYLLVGKSGEHWDGTEEEFDRFVIKLTDVERRARVWKSNHHYNDYEEQLDRELEDADE